MNPNSNQNQQLYEIEIEDMYEQMKEECLNFVANVFATIPENSEDYDNTAQCICIIRWSNQSSHG